MQEEPIFDKDFFKYSILDDALLVGFVPIENDEYDMGFIYRDMVNSSINTFENVGERLIEVIDKTYKNQFQEALMTLGSTHSYRRILNDQIRLDYKSLRSLLKDLIGTHSISSEQMLVTFQQQWAEKYNTEINHRHRNFHHIALFREFKKIKSMDEVLEFNKYYKQYFLRLLLDFTNTYVQKLHYTYYSIKATNDYKDFCIDLNALYNALNFDLDLVKSNNK